jgi:hypothetical protein
MSKKFRRTYSSRQLSIKKIKAIIVKFLDKHEADIAYEDMSSEIVKQAMAEALAEVLVDNGAAITYLKIEKKNDGEHKA